MKLDIKQAVKDGVQRAMKECELTIGMTLKEAIEKQIPKKYELFNGQCSCPNCKVLFGSNETRKQLIAWSMPYCKYCGQKLDWSDNNEPSSM